MDPTHFIHSSDQQSLSNQQSQWKLTSRKHNSLSTVFNPVFFRYSQISVPFIHFQVTFCNDYPDRNMLKYSPQWAVSQEDDTNYTCSTKHRSSNLLIGFNCGIKQQLESIKKTKGDKGGAGGGKDYKGISGTKDVVDKQNQEQDHDHDINVNDIIDNSNCNSDQDDEDDEMDDNYDDIEIKKQQYEHMHGNSLRQDEKRYNLCKGLNQQFKLKQCVDQSNCKFRGSNLETNIQNNLNNLNAQDVEQGRLSKSEFLRASRIYGFQGKYNQYRFTCPMKSMLIWNSTQHVKSLHNNNEDGFYNISSDSHMQNEYAQYQHWTDFYDHNKHNIVHMGLVSKMNESKCVYFSKPNNTHSGGNTTVSRDDKEQNTNHQVNNVNQNQLKQLVLSGENEYEIDNVLVWFELKNKSTYNANKLDHTGSSVYPMLQIYYFNNQSDLYYIELTQSHQCKGLIQQVINGYKREFEQNPNLDVFTIAPCGQQCDPRGFQNKTENKSNLLQYPFELRKFPQMDDNLENLNELFKDKDFEDECLSSQGSEDSNDVIHGQTENKLIHELTMNQMHRPEHEYNQLNNLHGGGLEHIGHAEDGLDPSEYESANGNAEQQDHSEDSAEQEYMLQPDKMHEETETETDKGDGQFG